MFQPVGFNNLIAIADSHMNVGMMGASCPLNETQNALALKFGDLLII